MHNSPLGCQDVGYRHLPVDHGLEGRLFDEAASGPGRDAKTAWHLAHRIREAFENEAVAFAGPLEVDETYMGSKEKNKHQSKKLKKRRGTVGKVAVIGAKYGMAHTNGI